MSGRNLTPDEVEDVLDKLENLIAITLMVTREGFVNPENHKIFLRRRNMAGLVWSRAVCTIDGVNEEYGDPDEYSND